MRRLQTFFRNWRTDRRGNFAMIFAIALIPILTAAGAAVDISRAYIVETRLKAALDAAALAVGGAPGQTNAQIQQMAQAFFTANYPATKIGVPGTLTVSEEGNVVTLTVSADMPTTLMGIVGIDTLSVGANSQVTRMGKKLEVALVLDNTGSMSSNSKMTTLKTAAKNLITIVSAAALEPGDVKVAIVPFTVDVNVGTSNESANWLRWDKFTSSGNNGNNNGNNGNNYGNNYGNNNYGSCSIFDIIFGNCNNSNNGGGNSNSHAGWDGCVMDRDQDYDVKNTLPPSGSGSSGNEKRYPASENDSDNKNCNLQTIKPLSYDWSALNSHIDNMKADGSTNTTIGLAWGWNMLTQGAPLSTAKAPANDLDKAIVFLTDGDNTKNSWTNSESSINARTSLVCSGIKAAGIKIYSVRVFDGNATLIRNCATEPGMYYSVNSASELNSVFTSIAQSLSNLRLSK